MFLCVPVFVLDGSLCNIFGSLRNVFGHLRVLSDPYEKSWHSYDKKCHAYKCKKVGRYKMPSTVLFVTKETFVEKHSYH